MEFIGKKHVKAIMDDKGRAIDNIFIERLWRTVKQGYIYICQGENGRDLYQELSKNTT